MKISRVVAAWSLVAALSVVSPRVLAQERSPLASNGYTVVLDVEVNEQGKAERIALVSTDDTSAGDVLIKMAMAMAEKTNFPPRVKDGKPVKYKARAPFHFPIEGDEGLAADELPKPRVKQGTAILPVYPKELRDQGIVGGAVLELIVDAQGNLSKVRTLRASHPEFEAAAVECIKKWQFAAALKDGQPVESRSNIALVFDTEDAMADLKWRIPPRPKLGSFVVIKPKQPITDEEWNAYNSPETPAAPAAGTADGASPAAPATPPPATK